MVVEVQPKYWCIVTYPRLKIRLKVSLFGRPREHRCRDTVTTLDPGPCDFRAFLENEGRRLRVDDHWEVWMVVEEAIIMKVGLRQSFIYCRRSTPDSEVRQRQSRMLGPAALAIFHCPKIFPFPPQSTAGWGRRLPISSWPGLANTIKFKIRMGIPPIALPPIVFQEHSLCPYFVLENPRYRDVYRLINLWVYNLLLR
jgi:hypothetical protein